MKEIFGQDGWISHVLSRQTGKRDWKKRGGSYFTQILLKLNNFEGNHDRDRVWISYLNKHRLLTMLILRFFLSFKFAWEDIPFIQDSVSPHFKRFEVHQRYSAARRVFSTLFSVFGYAVKHDVFLFNRSYSVPPENYSKPCHLPSLKQGDVSVCHPGLIIDLYLAGLCLPCG